MLNNNSTKLKFNNEVQKVNSTNNFANLFEDKNHDVFAIKINNEIRSIFYPLNQDSECEIVTYYSDEGERIYSRSLKFLLLMALHNLYPDMKLEFTNKIGRDYFIRILNSNISKRDVKLIKNEMGRLISCNYEIKKVSVDFETARRIYLDMNNIEQLENFEIKTKDFFNFYECNGYYNYLYGMVVPTTAYIKKFELEKVGKNSILLILPFKNDVNSVDFNTKVNYITSEFDKIKKFSTLIGIKNVADINNNVLNGNIGNIIRYAEAEQERRLVKITRKVVRKNTIKIIFIAGPSSSGKTTFSQRLADQLKIDGKNAIAIAMDNYFQDEEFIPRNEYGEYDFENINNVDISLFEKQMLQLLNGESVEIPIYNFKEHKKEYRGNIISLNNDDVLIIEGIHALNPIIYSKFKQELIFKIYISPFLTLGYDNYTKVSSNDTRLLRRIVRDYQSRSTSAEETLKIWKAVRDSEEKNIFPYIKDADIIYNSSLIYEVGVLKPFAENLLLCIDTNSEYYSDARRLYKMLNNFRTIETTDIPSNSIIKEFVGKGCFYR